MLGTLAKAYRDSTGGGGCSTIIVGTESGTVLWEEGRLQLRSMQGKVNLAEEGIDLAVRVGELNDSSLVARRLGIMELATIAAPRLLASTPLATLGDLALAPCVAFRQPSTGRERPWAFVVDGRPLAWSPRARVVLDSGEAMVEAAVAGLGATQVPAPAAAAALAAGDVVEILTAHRARPLPMSAIYLATKKLPQRTRAFLTFLVGLRAWGPPSARGSRHGGG